MRAAWLLAWRSLADRPWRSALLLLGYGLGVGVMIVLLSVGDALLSQARDRDLVAGGDVVLLPQGVDPTVLKAGGVTSMFLTIPHAGFIVREVLGGPRFGSEIAAAAPEIQNRVVYLRVHGRIVPATASAGIPSLDRAAHATDAVPGARDDPADRAWLEPSAVALYDRIDHFHTPPAGQRRAWAEWDYFNFVDPRTGAYGYLTVLAGDRGRGAILLRLRRPGRPVDDLALQVPIASTGLSTATVAQRIGPARIWIDAGAYRVTIDDPRVHADLRLVPAPGYYLPPGETVEEGVVSGYVVPVVRGRMSGTIRTARTSLRLSNVPGYHDHNWGTWAGVTWEWGEASSARSWPDAVRGGRAGAGGAILYGTVHVPGGTIAGAGGRAPALFAWAPAQQGRGGFLGVFPIVSLAYGGWHPGPIVDGRRVPAPSLVTIDAGEGRETVRVQIRVRDALGSLPLGSTAAATASGASGRPTRSAARVFLQLRGEATVRGRIDGRSVVWSGPAASETFVRVTR
jgi:hypothetical protein